MPAYSITQHSNHIFLLQKAYKNDLTSTVEEKLTKCHSTTKPKNTSCLHKHFKMSENKRQAPSAQGGALMQ